jgi:hypothetical protein
VIGKPRGVRIVAAYPEYANVSLTIDAARDLAAQVRAGFTNRPLAAKAAYTVVGFGLLQMVGEPSDGFGGVDYGMVNAIDISDETAMVELDSMAVSLKQTIGESPDGVSGPITGIVTAALIRWATKVLWRLITG